MSHALVKHPVRTEILDEAGGRMRTSYAVVLANNQGVMVDTQIEILHAADALPVTIQDAIIQACRAKGGEHGLAIQANRVFLQSIATGI